jgi:hypothetical protein
MDRTRYYEVEWCGSCPEYTPFGNIRVPEKNRGYCNWMRKTIEFEYYSFKFPQGCGLVTKKELMSEWGEP